MPSATDYSQKKKNLRRWLTVYGRNVVESSLSDSSLTPKILHLADSNRASGSLDRLVTAAEGRGLEIRYHSRDALSRISKNKQQDQGVALDIECPRFSDLGDFLASVSGEQQTLFLLDRITNQQNLGMIIRSLTAAGVSGMIIPEDGCAPLGPLVIKASAGTLFQAPILRCTTSLEAVNLVKDYGFKQYALSSHASDNLFTSVFPPRRTLILGNETDGVSKVIEDLCDSVIAIPMHNGVESLNVAVTAALIAYHLDK